jgi:hypothetical protein
MSVNISRSMSQSLRDGATDGKYRKVAPDRQPVPNMGIETTLKNRAALHPWWNYGYPTQEEPEAARAIPGMI